MDDAFANLDDISDEQALEHLERLFQNSDDSIINQLDADGDNFDGLESSSSSNVVSAATSVSTKSTESRTSIGRVTTPNAVVKSSTRSVSKPAFAAPPIFINAQAQHQPILQPILQPGVVQIQLQPTSTPNLQVVGPGRTRASGMGHQPQLLPKPSPGSAAAVSNSNVILTSMPATTSPILIGSNILIQQPQASPSSLIVLRPTVVSSSGSGAILQPQVTPQVAPQSQGPQIRIITPNGRMQMQQIQTPTGPKLIAVPVLNPTAPLAPNIMGANVVGNNVVNKMGNKKSESRSIQQTTTSEKPKVDLGALMKDVGLTDLEGFDDSSEKEDSKQSVLEDAHQQQPSIPVQANSNLQLVQAANGNFVLQPVPSLNAVQAQVASPVRIRPPPMNDCRLPPGWSRRINQRKSGASAGRFEVFIIGPNGKRFRSRNELKSYFDKHPEEPRYDVDLFDFSTFGSTKSTEPSETTPTATRSVLSHTTPDLLQGLCESTSTQETADADAQISRMLESLQNKSGESEGKSHAEDDGFESNFGKSIRNNSEDSDHSIDHNNKGAANNTTTTTTTFNPSITPSSTTLSNVGSDARLVQGTNGQLALQRVHTIELTADMQQKFKTVQMLVLNLQRKSVRTPAEEQELSQLLIKQQQILSTGRPVPMPKNLPAQLISQQQVQNQAPSQLQQQLQFVQTSSRPNVQMQNRSLLPSAQPSTPQLNQQTMGSQLSSGAGSSTIVLPTLTENQKRIVHDFKRRMSQLPVEQQAAFIREHKSFLIKQLNFHPGQLQQLRQGHLQSQQQQQPQQDGQQHSAKNIVVPTVHQQQPQSIAENIHVPNPLKRPQAPDSGNVARQKKIAWVESQIRKDQNEALQPNLRCEFKTKEDACKRLLRYHVFHTLEPDPEEEREQAMNFEHEAGRLLDKYRGMLDKFHHLLLKESMRTAASSEEVMLARMWDADERQLLAREKEDFEKGLKTYDLPPLPSAWQAKFDELYPSLATEGAVDDHLELGTTSSSTTTTELGTTSNSTTTTTTTTRKRKRSKRRKRSAPSGEQISEDPEYLASSLEPSMLQPMEEDVLMLAEEALSENSDSVQHAINSILDEQQGERMETPDLSLLDAIDEDLGQQGERDPVTEAAVRSIT